MAYHSNQKSRSGWRMVPRVWNRPILRCGLVLGAVVLATTALAESIPVPGGSFESPVTAFVTNNIDFWQKTPKPDWYQGSGESAWELLTGIFMNTAPTNSDHIDNCDGSQAVYIFAVPQVGLLQDFDSLDASSGAPMHAFDATFEVGKAYKLAVGVAGGGGGMMEGASLSAALYYRDASSNMVTVASTNITYHQTSFPTTTHLVDFSAVVPTIQPGDPWAGAHIGVALISTVDPMLAAGYWDVDNVRLSATAGATLLHPAWSGGKLTFTIQGEQGSEYEVLASSALDAPSSSWTQVGTVTNTNGVVSFEDTAAGETQRFYRVNRLP